MKSWAFGKDYSMEKFPLNPILKKEHRRRTRPVQDKAREAWLAIEPNSGESENGSDKLIFHKRGRERKKASPKNKGEAVPDLDHTQRRVVEPLMTGKGEPRLWSARRQKSQSETMSGKEGRRGEIRGEIRHTFKQRGTF